MRQRDACASIKRDSSEGRVAPIRPMVVQPQPPVDSGEGRVVMCMMLGVAYGVTLNVVFE
jgi:hypothetical protein